MGKNKFKIKTTRYERKIAAGVLPLCYTTGRVLLCKRNPKQTFPNTWGLWGGKFDKKKDITLKDTAKREFWEESRHPNIPYTISKHPIHIKDDNHVYFHTYLGFFDKEFDPQIEIEDEAADFGWFYISAMPKDLSPYFRETFNETRHIIKNYVYQFQQKD